MKRKSETSPNYSMEEDYSPPIKRRIALEEDMDETMTFDERIEPIIIPDDVTAPLNVAAEFPVTIRPDSSRADSTTCQKWVFVVNNWTEDEYQQLKLLTVEHCRWLVIAKEVGPTNGVPHLQGEEKLYDIEIVIKFDDETPEAIDEIHNLEMFLRENL